MVYGAVDGTGDPLVDPEISHLVAQYEAPCGIKEGNKHTSHHEDTERAQKVFLEKVEKLSQAMTDIGNPLREESQDLLSLDTRDIASQGFATFQSLLVGYHTGCHPHQRKRKSHLHACVLLSR